MKLVAKSYQGVCLNKGFLNTCNGVVRKGYTYFPYHIMNDFSIILHWVRSQKRSEMFYVDIQDFSFVFLSI